jgi:hypothetical protein
MDKVELMRHPQFQDENRNPPMETSGRPEELTHENNAAPGTFVHASLTLASFAGGASPNFMDQPIDRES